MCFTGHKARVRRKSREVSVGRGETPAAESVGLCKSRHSSPSYAPQVLICMARSKPWLHKGPCVKEFLPASRGYYSTPFTLVSFQMPQGPRRPCDGREGLCASDDDDDDTMQGRQCPDKIALPAVRRNRQTRGSSKTGGPAPWPVSGPPCFSFLKGKIKLHFAARGLKHPGQSREHAPSSRHRRFRRHCLQPCIRCPSTLPTGIT